MTRSICDLLDDHGDNARVMQPIFRDFGGRSKFHGQVTTIRCFEDNALLKATLGTPGAGRVMVVDGGGSLERALFGDKLSALLLENGWSGIVINGAVRDVEVIKTMPIAVRGLAVCPRQPRKEGKGERDVVVSFAGVTLSPGDWLYADENGAILSAKPIE
ncbi:MAG: ribonuclease E activity regulator RraA [Gammaproteobacteria bacterium]